MGIGWRHCHWLLACLVACKPNERCVQGRTEICACPGGASGAQQCGPGGAYGPCSCAVPVAGSAVGPSASDRCAETEAVDCSRVASSKLVGWKLHELVFAARTGGRFDEAICLAKASASSTDAVLVGASYYETALAWDKLGCRARAIASIEASLRSRLKGVSGWAETCATCVQLGATCGACKDIQACPSGDALIRVAGRALRTSDTLKIEACAPGAFPKPGWALVVLADDNRSDDPEHERYHRHHAVVTVGGELVADTSEGATALTYDKGLVHDTKSLRAIDFDGDGTDELVEEHGFIRRGWMYGYVSVHSVTGRTEELLSIQTSYDDGGMAEDPKDATSCSANWRIDASKSTIMIIIDQLASRGPRASEHCTARAARYRMTGGKLVTM